MDNNNSKRNYKVNQGLIYLLIALVTFIITICFFKLIEFGTGDTQFTSKFEFGATISSIILSVVAIVYTLIQSKQSDVINAKVMDASDEIEKNSTVLSNSVEGIKSEVDLLKTMDIDGILKTNMKLFGEKLGELEELLNGGFKGIEESIHRFNVSNIRKSDGQNIDSLEVKHLEFILKRLSSEWGYSYPLHLCIYVVVHFYINFNSDKNKDIHNIFYRYCDRIAKELYIIDPMSSKANFREQIELIYFLFLNIGFFSDGKTLNIKKEFLIERLNELRDNSKKFAPKLEPCYKKIDILPIDIKELNEL